MKMKETLSYQPLVLVRTNTTQKSFLRSATANNTHYSTVAHSSILPALNCFSKLWSSPKKHILRLSPKDDQSIMTLKRDFHMALLQTTPITQQLLTVLSCQLWTAWVSAVFVLPFDWMKTLQPQSLQSAWVDGRDDVWIQWCLRNTGSERASGTGWDEERLRVSRQACTGCNAPKHQKIELANANCWGTSSNYLLEYSGKALFCWENHKQVTLLSGNHEPGFQLITILVLMV